MEVDWALLVLGVGWGPETDAESVILAHIQGPESAIEPDWNAVRLGRELTLNIFERFTSVSCLYCLPIGKSLG
jgi:hypothetical protein